MGLLISATEAAYLCGCSDRTIRRMIESDRLTPHEAQGPRRTRPADGIGHPRVGPSHWLIDLDDLAGAGLAIIEARRRELEERKASPARVRELEAENAQLRATVARLNERIRILTRYDGREMGDDSSKPLQPVSRPQAAPVHPEVVTASEPTLRSRPAGGSSYQRKPRRTTDTPEMPDHLFALARLCEAHGVPLTTATKQYKEAGRFQVTGPYKVGRNVNVWAIDRENAARALRYWFFGSSKPLDRAMLGNCFMPGCLCGELKEGI